MEEGPQGSQHLLSVWQRLLFVEKRAGLLLLLGVELGKLFSVSMYIYMACAGGVRRSGSGCRSSTYS